MTAGESTIEGADHHNNSTFEHNMQNSLFSCTDRSPRHPGEETMRGNSPPTIPTARHDSDFPEYVGAVKRGQTNKGSPKFKDNGMTLTARQLKKS